jgi:hypothetical protein
MLSMPVAAVRFVVVSGPSLSILRKVSIPFGLSLDQ